MNREAEINEPIEFAEYHEANSPPIPNRRFDGAGLCIVAAACWLAFFVLMAEPTPIAMLCQYGALFIAASLSVCVLTLKLRRMPRFVFVVSGLASVLLWAPYDFEEVRRSIDNRTIVDTRYRWSKRVTHRLVAWNDGSRTIMSGPVVGTNATPHGEWYVLTGKPRQSSYVWLWHGEEVSEAEWHRLEKTGTK